MISTGHRKKQIACEIKLSEKSKQNIRQARKQKPNHNKMNFEVALRELNNIGLMDINRFER